MMRTMKTALILVAVVLASGCQLHHSVPADAEFATLTGVVIEKPWEKSYESWNAGGSEYYVLKVADADLPPGTRTAAEGVILRPSKAIPFERFKDFVGQTVRCRGVFVAGEPYIPPKNSVEQMPSPDENPFTGEVEYPIRGSGFQVHVIEVDKPAPHGEPRTITLSGVQELDVEVVSFRETGKRRQSWVFGFQKLTAPKAFTLELTDDDSFAPSFIKNNPEFMKQYENERRAAWKKGQYDYTKAVDPHPRFHIKVDANYSTARILEWTPIEYDMISSAEKAQRAGVDWMHQQYGNESGVRTHPPYGTSDMGDHWLVRASSVDGTGDGIVVRVDKKTAKVEFNGPTPTDQVLNAKLAEISQKVEAGDVDYFQGHSTDNLDGKRILALLRGVDFPNTYLGRVQAGPDRVFISYHDRNHSFLVLSKTDTGWDFSIGLCD